MGSGSGKLVVPLVDGQLTIIIGVQGDCALAVVWFQFVGMDWFINSDKCCKSRLEICGNDNICPLLMFNMSVTCACVCEKCGDAKLNLGVSWVSSLENLVQDAISIKLKEARFCPFGQKCDIDVL
jgi:hypothetical protein